MTWQGLAIGVAIWFAGCGVFVALMLRKYATGEERR